MKIMKLVLPFGEHKIILDQYLYELVILSLPRKRVHPELRMEPLKSEIIEILDELKPSDSDYKPIQDGIN